MIDNFSEAENLLLDFDIFPKFSVLIDQKIMSSFLGGQFSNIDFAQLIFDNMLNIL
jgi:hypothetical protein